MSKVMVVVPCFNEADRLNTAAFKEFAVQSHWHFLFVDDGSTDQTADLLTELSEGAPESFSVLALPENQGKGEAVRQGLLNVLSRGAEVVGFLDADLSTPLDELPSLLENLERPGVEVVVGSRVALMGRDINRRGTRHYLGRVFASAASLVLKSGFYDTQCGAKFFRHTPSLKNALAEPFLSRWVFDVEILGRLLCGAPGIRALGPQAFVEVPLQRWQDVPGSKLSPLHMARAAWELEKIRQDLNRRRQQ